MVVIEGSNDSLIPSGLSAATCQALEEDRDACWQSLVQHLNEELAASQNQLQQAEAEKVQLAQDLLEQEAQTHALMEAMTAQAQQFSETLKQLRQNQAQVVQSEKMAGLGQLVAGVAHEINNPVNFIFGNLRHADQYVRDLMQLLLLYQQHYPQPDAEIEALAEEVEVDFLTEDLPKLLSSMRVGAERIQKIVLSLRTFSRMDEADMKAVDIHEGIESTLMILQNRLKATTASPAIQVVKEYGELPLVECYAGQLNQVFMNILVNAIDAILEQGAQSTAQDMEKRASQITIRTAVVDSTSVCIAIEDTGPGMTEEVLHRIFDPFFTTKPVGKGTGLGMAISHQIVTEKHGGELTCISVPNRGTEFVIQIPIRQIR
ncbi:MAG TPA: ATP-binding protein [Leptolyngbyaceae cyanobacterium]